MTEPTQRLPYTAALDGLRGIAILAVVLFHGGLAAHIETGRPGPGVGGFLGVDVFFVLSGFLITTLLLDERRRFGRVHLGWFYMRRVLRLLPALLVMLVATVGIVWVLVAQGLLPDFQFRWNLIDAAIALGYATNWSRALDWHPANFLSHTWSLSLEEQFYLVWPILLLGMLRWLRSTRSALAVTLLLCAASWWHRLAFVPSDGADLRGLDLEWVSNLRWDPLMAGCALAIVLGNASERLRGRLSTWSRWLAPVALVALVGLFATCRIESAWTLRFGYVLATAAAAVLIVAGVLVDTGPVPWLLRQKALVWVGATSYGLYLWHWPVLLSLFFLRVPQPWFWAAGAALSLVLTALSFYLIERPVLRWKHRFTRSSA